MFSSLRATAFNGLLLLTAAALTMLTGCGAGSLAGPSSTPAFKITGNVHGGAYPIQGATIRLMETQSTGTWSTTTNSYSGTAKQLLSTTSDATGYFTFPDTGWTCDAGQYAYITVTGGHTAVANNYNVVQVGVIGACSTTLANQTEIDNVNVYISELSTVAAAYALGNFISIDNTNASTGQQLVNITSPAATNAASPGCTGSGATGTTALACTHAGLAHAFLNAYNLVDQVTYGAGQFPTGAARATLPGNSQAVAPQVLVNTLGNILQSCVDSAGGSVGTYSSYTPGGSSSTHCGDLFYWATPPGQTTAPTNTLQAALNMARYPNNNVDSLFKLQPLAVFFTPTMTADTMSGGTQLMSFTLSIFYTGTGLPNDTGMAYPVELALDENDNVYVLYSGGNSGSTYGAVNEFASNGTGVFAGAHSTTIPNPSEIALDSRGYAWVANDALLNGNVYQINTPSSGGTNGALGTTIAVTGGYAAGVALDMSNNVWVTRDATTGQSLFRFNAASSYAATTFSIKPSLGANCKRLFVDFRQNVLGVTSNMDGLGGLLNSSTAQVWQFPYNTNGTSTVLHSAALNAANGFAITMSNTDSAYMPLSGELDTETGYTNGQLSVNGAGTYTAASGTNGTYTTPMGVGMDGLGNLFWSDFESSAQIFWMQPSSTTSVSSGTLTSFYPCKPVNGQCASASASYLRGMALDSAGAIWYVADSSTGTLIQTIGVAAPTYPLISYAHNGVMIQ